LDARCPARSRRSANDRCNSASLFDPRIASSDQPRKTFGDIAPHLAEITDKVLFGDVWENSALSPRDRSLVTIVSLISLYRANEITFHLKRRSKTASRAKRSSARSLTSPSTPAGPRR
jgi:Carboxymuconolactone decarboxylase family